MNNIDRKTIQRNIAYIGKIARRNVRVFDDIGEALDDALMTTFTAPRAIFASGKTIFSVAIAEAAAYESLYTRMN